MGFNSIITIRNADLDAIAADQGFGEAVHAAITGVDHVCYVNQKAGKVRTFRAGVRMSEVAPRFPQARKPYDLMTAPSHHASGEEVFLIRDGELRTIPRPARHVPFDDWLALANVASSLGVQSMFAGKHDTRRSPTHPRKEREIMRDWSGDAFLTATTSVCVLNDGLDRIRDSKDFGARLAERAAYVWNGQKVVFDAQESDPEFLRQAFLPRDIRAGNHGNPASIIGFTPEEETDVLIIGGNYGRILRREPQAEDLLRPHLAEFREQDVRTIKRRLLEAGFSAQHQAHRMQPPVRWLKEEWADPDYRRDQEADPEPEAALQL